jgi:lysine 2,3-aminomutase
LLDGNGFETALAYIAANPQIFEVILTGGDPLTLSPRRINEITQRLAAIPHVAVLRWHSRVPVAAPELMTDAMVEALKAPGKAVYVALHANHPRELTPAASAACARLIDSGIVMVSQSVLLKGVNDDVATMSALMRAFVALRIKPYYLHQGDLAPGTAHLRTSIKEGLALMKALRGRISGLAQPHYVLDIPGGAGKVPLNDGSLLEGAEGPMIEDINGALHPYPPRG